MFDLETTRIINWIRDRGFSSVALQLPEGLKSRASDLADTIFKGTGADVIIIGRPCYGACDLFTDYHRYADALVHFGHSQIPSLGSDPDVMYVEGHTSLDISDVLEAAVDFLPEKVGLLATVQYVDMLPKACDILEKHGIVVFIGTGDIRIMHPGQVLGCNCSSALSVQDRVDGFLFIGEGDFHPLAAAFGVKKPMKVLNPITGDLRDVNEVRDRIMRRRFAAIESSRNAKDFLVIVSDKVGQDRMDAARAVSSKLRAHGRDAHIIVMGEVSPEALMPFKADAYVCTACPRIAMDDSVRYPRPMLTLTEVDHVLGLRDWDDYTFDSI